MPLYRPSMPQGYTPPTGGYQQPANMLSSTGAAQTSGQCSWTPVDVGPASLTIQSLVVHCTTAGAGGTYSVFVGLYLDDGTGGAPLLTPAGLLISGTVSTSAAGLRPYAVAATLAPGRYWTASLYFASAAPTTVPQLNGNVNGSPTLWQPSSATTLGLNRALIATGLSALPTAPVTYAIQTTGTSAIVALRRA